VEPEGGYKQAFPIVKMGQTNNAPSSAKAYVSSHSIEDENKRIKTHHEVVVQAIKASGDKSPKHRINRKLSNPYDELVK
jgi:hypothetical protein